MFAGPGCRPGTASAALYDVNSDGLADEFMVFFSEYSAEQGTGVSPGRRASSCMIAAQLRPPRNLQFAVQEVTFLGYADVPAGVTATQQSSYSFPSIARESPVQTVLAGPYTDEFSRTDVLNGGNMLWSKCGSQISFVIRTRMWLSGPRNLPASIMGDQLSGLLSQKYHVIWRECM
jgi:hypothetical protein